MKKALVIYHKDCPSGDGFAAALAAWMKFGDTADYLPANYRDSDFPGAKGKDVYILDLSFGPLVLNVLAQQATKVILLDHHVSAQQKLQGYALPSSCCGSIHFDMTKSGAVLAWEYFHPNQPVPALFRYIQTRDLWAWTEPKAIEFLAWLDSQPKTFEQWGAISQYSNEEVQEAILSGQQLHQQYLRYCCEIAEEAQPVVVAGHRGLMVNCNGAFRNDVGNLLAIKAGTFSISWRVMLDGAIMCSMRSIKGFNVATIAEQFGGGGHEEAAAFEIKPEQLLELLKGQLTPLRHT